MELKIFREKEVENRKPIYFKLVENNNVIILKVVNKDGNGVPGGNILSIDSKGLYTYPSVDKNIGLPLTVFNEIEISASSQIRR